MEWTKKLGPGLLFAGAAIGVSHLVQSTRAGADFGWGLLWALLFANLFKYPFFEYGTRYALATGNNLLEGYSKLGKHYLWGYFLLNLATMFTIQTAVTIVTASLASILFGEVLDLVLWSAIITLGCLLILWSGNYRFLDRIIKWIILILSISTIITVIISGSNTVQTSSFTQIFPSGTALIFLAAFMGWMPAPMDISIWQSIWSQEKSKTNTISVQEGLFDYKFGYMVTLILGICFMGLGTFVLYGSGTTFSNNGSAFAKQLIDLYTATLGKGVYPFIAIAAFTTMFSTTLTTLDASPRAMENASKLLFPQKEYLNFRFWILLLSAGTVAIFTFLLSEMGTLVQVATLLSFVTAPFYAFLNYKLVNSKQMPLEHRPSKGLHVLSILGFIFLSLFALGFLFLSA